MDLDSIFKAYDVRGLAPDQLDAEAARRIGAAFAAFTAAPVVAVGRDARATSSELSAAFIDGVTAAGVDAWDIGEVTTDLLYFVTGSQAVAGAMITASHNPPEYNGIKFAKPGAAPVAEDSGLGEIKQGARNGVPTAGSPGAVSTRDFTEPFVDHLLSVVDADHIAPLKVVADAGNGMAGVVLPPLFARLPATLDGLYLEPDFTFPNHPADPLRPENLEDLVARVRETRADLGVAFDGDADRAFFVDDRGQALNGSATTAMIASWFLQREPGAAVVHNLITSRAVPEIVTERGGKPVRTRVGHSFIKAVMAETDAVFGGEHSAHFYFRENYRADSGTLALLVLLRLLSDAGAPLSELRQEYEPYVQSGEINYEVADKVAAMESVVSALDGEVDRLDGVTVSWPDRWLNLRASNTEPVLRLNVEASTRHDVDELVKRVEAVLQP